MLAAPSVPSPQAREKLRISRIPHSQSFGIAREACALKGERCANLREYVFDFKTHRQLVPMHPGDEPTTYADVAALECDFRFTLKITLREGLRHFAEWYAQFYDHE